MPAITAGRASQNARALAKRTAGNGRRVRAAARSAREPISSSSSACSVAISGNAQLQAGELRGIQVERDDRAGAALAGQSALSPADAMDRHASPGCTSSAVEQDVGVLPDLGVADRRRNPPRWPPRGHALVRPGRAGVTRPVLPSISTTSPSRSQASRPATETTPGMPISRATIAECDSRLPCSTSKSGGGRETA